MVKTKGGGVGQASASQSTDRDAPAPTERVQPIASARQRRTRQVEQHVQQHDNPAPAQDVPKQDRGTLKVVTHGRKLKKPKNDYIRDIVDDFGLAPLVEGTHSLVDRSDLLYAFTERWHRETSCFHLPIGEMTITLDDVSSLIHISVTVALAYLYEELNEASLHHTRQLAGYTTLLQAWILEHFPHITHIERIPEYVEGFAYVQEVEASPSSW
ncbi:Aminotransferase-like, plant mobile domain [Sesbania bispinosa]|nr:Aminotransferase-like, plant mobile domain [Sesbania bispinosa]